MSECNIARILYDAYPDNDLLLLDPETDCRNMESLHQRVCTESIGDGLFTFLVNEINESGGTLDNAIKAVQRAQYDLECVLKAFLAVKNTH